MIFYDFSGGMESAAMLVVELDRIKSLGACVAHGDTGRQFPEMPASIQQIESILGIQVVTVPRRITFDEFLFDKGGMIRKGTTDCSRRMKRTNLSRHMKTFPRPYEVNLGFNREEDDRADSFVDLNERPWLHWRFPLIERNISREKTWEICENAGFSILVGMYRKMGRFDCFMCGNQSPKQARLVAKHYPELAAKWMEDEVKKGHSFMPLPLVELIRDDEPLFRETGCSCFGGNEPFDDDSEGY